MTHEIDWQARVDRDASWAKKMLLTEGELMPMFAIHTPTEVKLIPALGDREDKATLRKLVALIALAEQAFAITFMAEAWARDVDPRAGESNAEWRERINAVAPSEAEDRIEILICSTTYRDSDGRHSIGRTMEIVRDAEDKVFDVIERPGGDNAEDFRGPMTELLCPVEPSEAAVERARDALAQLVKLGVIGELNIGRMN